METKEQVINRFEALVKTHDAFRERVQNQIDQANQVGEPTNPIILKGRKHQKRSKQDLKRAIAPTSDAPAKISEQVLHDIIVEYPFLLHTPELYTGGLYLDALLNKYRLPGGLITDFTYLTVQEKVIKVTLVEIEKASKGVFRNQLDGRSKFLSETEAAIRQVREWKETMQHDSMRKTLLINLKRLFETYPHPVFKPDGKLYESIDIEVSYVLIVGSESPHYKAHQDLIDDLYLNENIIFMTYPMMIEQLRNHSHDKNMLRLGPHALEVITLRRLDSLRPVANELNLPITTDNDPYGVFQAGTGWKLRAGRSRHHAMHPSSIKAIFYRSNGCCEKPGCNSPIITEVGVCGALSPIYNRIDNLSFSQDFWHINHVALTCPEHLFQMTPRDQIISLGQQHPLNAAMKRRAAYRSDLDQKAFLFSKNWQASQFLDVVKILEISLEKSPDLAENLNLQEWSLAVSSLSGHCQGLLADIVMDHFGFRPWKKMNRSAYMINNHTHLYQLHKARLIRVNRSADAGKEIEPVMFTPELIRHLENLFGGRVGMAIKSLCEADTEGLNTALLSARRQAKDEV
jgi:hypothetical protein